MDVNTYGAPGIDIELAKVLTTTIVSIILYGRQAFPENCFRKVSRCDLDDLLATHEHLLGSGQRLSAKDDPLHVLSPDDDTLVYMRESDNHRMRGLLADLDQIFAALADRRVGKIYICFTDSKQWSKESLLECYTLKFSYGDLGDFDIFIDWAGIDDTPLEEKIFIDVFESLKSVAISCPQLPDPFYTHLFVSSVDSKTKLKGSWAGGGHGVREALLQFQGRKGSDSGRVCRLSCAARSQEDAEEEEDDADAQLPLEVCPRVTTPELPELRNSAIKASVGSGPNLTASPARPRSEPSVSEEKTGPNKIVASHPRRQGPAHAALESGTRSYPDRVHAAVASSENPGHDGDSPARAGPSSSGSTLVESSLRRVSKKRSSTQDGFVPVTQNAEGDTTIASKHPRLAMIEEVPEDLPPTQRLETPSQSREAQKYTNVNPDFLFLF